MNFILRVYPELSRQLQANTTSHAFDGKETRNLGCYKSRLFLLHSLNIEHCVLIRKEDKIDQERERGLILADKIFCCVFNCSKAQSMPCKHAKIGPNI